MARIKLVLNERRLALLQAQKEVRSASSSTASSPEEEEDLWEDVNEEMVAEFEQKKWEGWEDGKHSIEGKSLKGHLYYFL